MPGQSKMPGKSDLPGQIGMLKQIRLLSGLQLCNLLGINEIRHTKDKGKRARFTALAAVWAILAAMMVFYIVMLSRGLAAMGAGEIIPVYLAAVCSLVILFFSVFQTGSVIFQMKTYDILASLPVSRSAIVVSRFLTMYVSNLLLSLLVIIPGMAVFVVRLHPAAGFYLFGILGILLLPLFPLTLATAVGAGITAISCRMRHKSIVSAFLTMVLVCGVVAGSTALSGGSETVSEEMLMNLAQLVNEKIGQVYPPALWFGNAAAQGSGSAFLLFAGVSAACFLIMTGVLTHYFLQVCTALNGFSQKNDYHMGAMGESSVTAALWKKEVKRYFASSIYVSNTMTGYLLMAASAVILLLAGPEKLEELMGMPGVVSGMLPLLMGFIASFMPTTACSVSMEGNQWWLLQSLPVRGRDVWNGKILMNLTVALPFYAVTVILCMIAVRPSPEEGIWLAVIPLCYIIFTSVLGLAVNLAMPVFEWESEVRVVKQSASGMVTMLMGMVSAIVPAAVLFLAGFAARTTVYAATASLLLLATGGLYVKISRRETVLREN